VAARNGKPAETGTEVETSSIEQDVAEANTEAVQAEEVPAGDPRESALAALMVAPGEPVVTAETVVVVDESVVIEFGGRSKAVVLFSHYNQFVDGLVKAARKGDVISTDAENLKRGVRIGALKKLEG
jgi:hypothetical protein